MDCRKHHGALFHASAIFPEDAVTVSGKTGDYHGRHFCPRCGSSVFGRSGDEVEVNLGALDAPDQLKPTYELWTVRREGWLPPFPLGPAATNGTAMRPAASRIDARSRPPALGCEGGGAHPISPPGPPAAGRSKGPCVPPRMAL